jgi:hypothetical protein
MSERFFISKYTIVFVTFEILAAVSMNNGVFQDATLVALMVQCEGSAVDTNCHITNVKKWYFMDFGYTLAQCHYFTYQLSLFTCCHCSTVFGWIAEQATLM